MRIIELLKKEYKLFIRNRKQVWTVVLLPLFFSLIYVLMFSFSNIDLTVSVCNLDKGEYSSSLVSTLSAAFETSVYAEDNASACFAVIKDDILSGKMLGIIIRSDFSENIANYEQPVLNLYFDNSKPNLGFFAQSYLMNQISSFNNEILRQTESEIKDTTYSIETDLEKTIQLLNLMEYAIPDAVKPSYDELKNNVAEYYNKISGLNRIDLEFLVNPVDTQLVGIFKGSNSDGFSFSVLYVVVNIIVILLLSSVSMVYDRKNKFLTRLKTSSTPVIYYIISKLLFFTLIGFVIFVPSYLVFAANNAYFNTNIITLITGLILVSGISALIGCVIGLSSSNESSSTMISVFIGFLFLLLSGLFYPVDLLPGLAKSMLVLLPTSFEINLLNNALIFNTSIQVLNETIYYLAGYLLLFFGLNYYLIVKDQ
ncbi:hypothetical protein COS64_04525 [archaeon CG06_land_8_20_14_3_00_37_11]|nr:MAG: hypothetical protein COS64_04525 [archaeon CG06_land_8_20_14_3_00_37_11]